LRNRLTEIKPLEPEQVMLAEGSVINTHHLPRLTRGFLFLLVSITKQKDMLLLKNNRSYRLC